MAIPKDLTYEEVGAFLCAIGQHMMAYDVAASVTLTELPSNDEWRLDLQRAIVDEMVYSAIEDERAEQLTYLTLEEAIGYLMPQHLEGRRP